MLDNKEGTKVPEVDFKVQESNQWMSWGYKQLFAGKRVILFSLPGAYTPTCSSTHLPRYNELAELFAKENISDIYCLSVNDTFVMNAWKETQGAKNITFLPDGNGEFSSAMGMLVDKENIGFGKRSWRYSMVVNDGVIEKMFIEADIPGDPFDVSDADTMLNYLAPSAKEAPKVSLFTKPGCAHCVRAKQLLEDHNLSYEEIELGKNGLSYSSLSAVTGKNTTPQVYIDGVNIGGADELDKWLKD
ncbi:MAG: glutathione peroxidase [Gammaproteobacteria bacterium]|nr:MAG: glutathione peroxidase [Gammaproteobacteria bacterium]